MLAASFIWKMFLEYGFWLFVCFGLFSSLAEIFPSNKGQKLIRANVGTDLVYWFLAPVVYMQVVQWIAVAISYVFFWNIIEAREFRIKGLALFSDLPIYLQFIISLILMNIAEYATHRWLHGKSMWKFHVIHHAPTELDWLSGTHVHPVNMLVHSIATGTLVTLLGFSPIVFILRFPFDLLYAVMVHANLNWTFGPLRYIFASPVFHRFHHTGVAEGGERNFAPTFSFVDLIFGTFYMPKDRLPANFGVAETIPEGFMGQLMYPFRKIQK